MAYYVIRTSKGYIQKGLRKTKGELDNNVRTWKCPIKAQRDFNKVMPRFHNRKMYDHFQIVELEFKVSSNPQLHITALNPDKSLRVFP